MIPQVPIQVLNDQLAAEVAQEHGLGGGTTLENVLRLLNMGADARTLTEDKRIKLFHASLINGWVDVSMAMIQAGTDVSKTAKGENVPGMMTLAGCFDQAIFDAVVLSGADLKAKDQRGRSLTHWAAMRGSIPLIEQLNLRGEINEEIDDQGNAPMHLAALKGHGKTCLTLVRYGSEVDVLDASGKTPLLVAACEGREQACMDLLSCGADPFFKFKKKSIWAMARARKKDHVADQIKAAADAKKASDAVARVTDFINALQGKPLPVPRMGKKRLNQELLLATQTVPQIQSLQGLQRLQGFIAAGADPACLSEETRLKVFFCSMVMHKDIGPELALSMLHAGTDISANVPASIASNRFPTFLMLPHFFEERVFEHLLTLNLDPDARDEAGRSMFHALCRNGNWKAAQQWLSLGASEDLADKQGHLPLHAAAERGHAHVCRSLIERGADPNALTPKNESPLLLAATSGKQDACLALLGLGADPFFVQDVLSIRELAAIAGHEGLADQLKAWEDGRNASCEIDQAMARARAHTL